MDCVALLDDRAATRARPSSRLYEGFEREHRCVDPLQLDTVWARVDIDQRAGLLSRQTFARERQHRAENGRT